MPRPFWPLALLLALAGCRHATADASAPAPAPAAKADPAALLEERWREGAFQVATASDLLADLRNDLDGVAKALKGEERENVLDVLDVVDSVGVQVGDYAVAPSPEEIRHDLAQADEERLKAIEGVNAALVEVREGIGLTPYLPTSMARLVNNDLEEVADGLEEAVRAFGGEVRAPG